MMNYEDKCPLCGTRINIQDATICPGCRSPLYYGPSMYDENSYVYYANQKQVEEARAIAIERTEQGFRAVENFGYVLVILVMCLWFFWGYSSWRMYFGWPLLFVGLFMIIAAPKSND